MGNQHYQPAWVREDFIDFIAEKVHPIWALKKIKAQIIAKKKLADDFVELTLKPNHNFKSNTYCAGQSILVTIRIGGIKQQRSYSIVQVFDNGHLSIAIKKQGLVSSALHQLQCTDIVEISQPQGEFIIQNFNQDSLMIASGSGITAIYALAKHFLAHSSKALDLIYFNRDQAYDAQLQALAAQYSNFTYHCIRTDLKKQHLSLRFLQKTVPNFQERLSYGCGTATMMQSLKKIYAAPELIMRLTTEYFQISADLNLAAQPITFLRAQRNFEGQGSLLESAERSGLKPTSGCRMGICNTCSCTKLQGSVRNILTGEVDHQPNTQIKLCISQAVSPVTINL